MRTRYQGFPKEGTRAVDSWAGEPRMIAASQLRMRVTAFPRVDLCNTPSPLQSLPSLADHWRKGSRLLMKRDDLIGPGMGGNKSRQLEFLLGDAVAGGADSIIHGGAMQSNYCRQLASAAAQLGLECHLVLSTAYEQPPNQGSHLLSRLFGATITFVDTPLGAEHEQIKLEIRDQLREQGRNPYLITYPRSEILGSLGYVLAACELTDQFADDVTPSAIVTSAVGATYAGLLLGFRLLGNPIPVIGFAPLSDEYDIVSAVKNSISTIVKELAVELPPTIFDDIDIRFTEVGDGYAQPSARGIEALMDCARLEGVLLDPVYSAKAGAGARGLLRPNETLIFLHTGGSPAVFAYADQLAAALDDLGPRGENKARH